MTAWRGYSWWYEVGTVLPNEGRTYFYRTRNGKYGVSHKPLDEWMQKKYAITHWMYPPEID